MIKSPPLGAMASRALMARLRMAVSSIVLSALTAQVFSPGMILRSTTAVRAWVSRSLMLNTKSLTVSSLFCRVCWREKANMRRVRSEPFSAASMAALMRLVARSSVFTICCTISRLPMTTIRRLLKSWAMPPVNWPTASIFWAWWYLRSRALRSVTLWQQPKTVSMVPASSRSASMLTSK